MPKRVDHDLRRRQIGEALLRIASTRGLQAASMREVATEAGVSLRLVQYYFHTKQELLLGALAYLGEQLSARVEAHIRALGMPPTPRSLVYGTLTAILPTDAESRRLTRTYAAYYALVLAEPHSPPTTARHTPTCSNASSPATCAPPSGRARSIRTWTRRRRLRACWP
ncbi:TetR/AcrR family transcriptional regulator [Catellatospora bangladeshensis]|uniref:TetR/AcrR family transcriptional regulator n=1 Tax=Catellatospora bangladeshensis TaxID=310355 RepID=UPI003610ABF0